MGLENWDQFVSAAQEADKYTESSKKDATVGDFRAWSEQGPYLAPTSGKVRDKLDPGVYNVRPTPNGVFLQKVEDVGDNLMTWKDGPVDIVLNDIDMFWKREQDYRNMGVLWKRGHLLFGPPGSGKTSILRLVAARLIERDAVAVACPSVALIDVSLKMIRQIEPKRPVVVMLEDLDEIERRDGAALLALLDGELQIDNMVVVATTNYPERLDKRITNRPSRFDLVLEVPMPGQAVRRSYLASKLDESDDLEKYVRVTEGFSIAHIKELVLAVKLFGHSFEDAARRLRNMLEGKAITPTGVPRGQYA